MRSTRDTQEWLAEQPQLDGKVEGIKEPSPLSNKITQLSRTRFSSEFNPATSRFTCNVTFMLNGPHKVMHPATNPGFLVLRVLGDLKPSESKN